MAALKKSAAIPFFEQRRSKKVKVVKKTKKKQGVSNQPVKKIKENDIFLMYNDINLRIRSNYS